ncbi:MAG: LON peptidase substrate-binding domain-containing protein [Marivibrio sp.]|uniref:LON peptidase substrate-binding domain-containing protein n=1 Tax=Marivibrio sp. TaxID=2039719 RepID=UPI0032EF3AB4
MSRFDPSFQQLPPTLPVFPLDGVLLLPRGMLPLNIFEPRYLNMIEDALKSDRMIGMIQPSAPAARSDKEPPLYETGCAGRIVAFEETDDGRFLISLKGVARFHVTEELATTRGYRRVRPDWAGFETDLEEAPHGAVARDKLFKSLRAFFKAQEIEASWDALNETPDERLVNSLAMICPFEASEKQALLEADSVAKRAEVLTALVEMAVLDTGGGGGDKAKQ